MRSLEEILTYSRNEKISLAETIVKMDSKATGNNEQDIRDRLYGRLMDMEQSVREADENTTPCRLMDAVGESVQNYGKTHKALVGNFLIRASEIAMNVASYNATMGRIVAAPTAGSCGILPGLFFSWKETVADSNDEMELNLRLTDALIIAGGVGEVIASRATLAGAKGGCQAECGAAAAMSAAGLVFLQGGTGEQSIEAVALLIKSILGLVCDPVGGLVEVPCIKRNGMLVSMGAMAADLALAGVKSVIPADEVIDTMSQVGNLLPHTLRETALGGLAITPSALKMVADLNLN